MQAWQAGSAYLYILHLDRPALAWEYMRRNPEYRRQWCAGELIEGPMLSAHWGCAVSENPDFDARIAQPCWNDSPDVIRVMATEKDGITDQPFSIWALPGARTLSYAGTHLELRSSHAATNVRLRIDHGVMDGDPYAYVIRADNLLHERLRTVRQFVEQTERSRETHEISKPMRLTRQVMTHARTLQAVDGSQAGASHRDIAIALFGAAEVTTQWTPDSELRAQVRYLIRRGLRLANGDYRSLLTYGAQRGQGEFES